MFPLTPGQDLLYKGLALFILLLCVIIIIVGIILVHDIPYKIAKKRKHPQQDAIRCMAIMGLFLIPLWFFAMIWAYMRGKTFGSPIKNASIQHLTEIIVNDDIAPVEKKTYLAKIKQKVKKTPTLKSTVKKQDTDTLKIEKNKQNKTENLTQTDNSKE